MQARPLLEVRNLYKAFPVQRRLLQQLHFTHGRLQRIRKSIRAINNLNLSVRRGDSLCVVGESGCGKSTLARVVMGLHKPSSGSIHYDGERIDRLSDSRRLPFRRRMQMIFQNPYASLNPRMTVQQMLKEPIQFHNPDVGTVELNNKVREVMGAVGAVTALSERYPHELSGGQRQRIAIARALTVDPEFIVADEPVSALDVSVQAQVLNLLQKAREQRALTYLFITHDLSVVEHFGSRVAVMYLGTLCELAPTGSLFHRSRHPYTRALLSAIPRLDRKHQEYIKLKGEVPTPYDLPHGCVFHKRCIHANARCKEEIPMLHESNKDHIIACHGVEEGRL